MITTPESTLANIYSFIVKIKQIDFYLSGKFPLLVTIGEGVENFPDLVTSQYLTKLPNIRFYGERLIKPRTF